MELTNLADAVAYWNMKQREDHPMAPVNISVCYVLLDFGYRPWNVVKFYGFDAEFISMPFPSEYGASIMVREPGDPTTMVKAAVNHTALRVAKERIERHRCCPDSESVSS